MRRITTALLCVFALLAWPGLAAAPSWSVVRGEVRVICPLTVGGSFEAKTAALAGTLDSAGTGPVTFAGQLSVDLRTLDTGIGLRDDHMRDKYLEVGRGSGFDKAVLSEIKLADADAETFQGRTRFSGTLSLHGTSRAVLGQAEIRREGTSVRVTAGFPVVLADYAIEAPQYLGVGVKREVQLRVSLLAAPR